MLFVEYKRSLEIYYILYIFRNLKPEAWTPLHPSPLMNDGAGLSLIVDYILLFYICKFISLFFVNVGENVEYDGILYIVLLCARF